MTRVPHVVFEVDPREVFRFMRKLVARGKLIYDSETKQPRHLPGEDCSRVVDYLEHKRITDLRILDHTLVTYHCYKRHEEWK